MRLRNETAGKRLKYGPDPLDKQKAYLWQHDLSVMREKLQGVNVKVDKFNLIVPIMTMQKVQYKFERELKMVDAAVERLILERESQVEEETGTSEDIVDNVQREGYKSKFRNLFDVIKSKIT